MLGKDNSSVVSMLSFVLVDMWCKVCFMTWCSDGTIQYKTCNAPYVTRMLFVGAGMTRD